MSNAAAFAALDAHIERIQTLPDIGKDAAPKVRDDIEDEIRRQIAAGTTPDGAPWEATRDGRKPLDGAEKSIGVANVGNRIVVRAWGHIARHGKGRARGGIKRQIIPESALPQRWADAIKARLRLVFSDHMRGDK